MLLVQQEKLHFKDEKSDKVYEVYLYHIQEDEYVVNFKYGRRGKKLTEGTKTVFPVSIEQAEKVFTDLVKSKTKKGYKRVGEYDNDTPKTTSFISEELTESAARSVVLSYLKERSKGEVLSTNWKLSRIIWRAGELRIDEAVPYIAGMLPTLQEYELYSSVWTLGRIANAECYAALKILDVPKTALHYNIYVAALLHCKDSTSEKQIINLLPKQLAVLYKAGDLAGFINTMKDYLFVLKSQDASFLLSCYYLTINNAKLRELFIPILKDVKLIPGYWKYVRYIFKISEMIEDGDSFGVIARSINLQHAFYNKPAYGHRVHVRGDWVDVKTELASADSKIAFSDRTKTYLVKRAVKRLRRAGYDRQESYCKFAAGILTAYSEQDEREHQTLITHSWDRESRMSVRISNEFTRMSHVPYFYYILYGGGDRLKIHKYGKFYSDTDIKAQTQREDSFPMLWDRYPQYVVKVLTDCRQRQAMDFALLFLKERADVDQLLSLVDLTKMINHPFEEVLEYSLEFIEKKYDPSNPDVNLILSLISSENDKAIALAIRLLDKNKDPFLKNIDFIKTAIVSQNEQIHIWLRENIKANDFSKEEQQSIIDYCLEEYLNYEGDDFNTHSPDSLLDIFSESLGDTKSEAILDMLDHPKLQIQLLGAKLININKREAHDWPDKVLLRLIESEYSEIRDEGMLMLSTLTDDQLLEKEDFIGQLASSEHEDLRINARNIIGRLAPQHTKFAERVFNRLYKVLLDEHEDEELPTDVYQTIEAHLLDQTGQLEHDFENVLACHKREIHLLTHYFLIHHAELRTWSIERIAKMGGHDMKSIREQSHTFYQENIDKIKYHKYEAISILDTDWEDTRDFAHTYFEDHFDAAEWEPELIINLCDSIRPETQVFGTEILSKYFKEENGVKYLSSLSEHPDPTIQLYTTNYLDRFAFNNMEILQKLEPYFLRILGSINSNRAAKLRAIRFLEKQSKEGELQARYVAEILNELLGTIAIRENEAYVELLRQIELTHENIDTDIEIVPLEIRS